MKTKTTVFIISIGLLIIGFVICLGAMIAAGFDDGMLNEGSGYEQREYVASADAFKSIKFDDSNKGINVVPSKDDKIRITYSDNDKNHYVISEMGETLSIEYSWKKRWYEYIGITWYFNFESDDVTISIPDAYAGNIDVLTSNGRIELHDIALPGELRADTSNSRIIADNVKGTDIHFITSNGTVEMRDVISENVIDVKTSNSKIETDNIQGKDIRLDTSNGHISLDRVKADSLYFDTSNSRITGTVVGRMTDFKITSHTSNAHNNLPENFDENGSKTLFADTSNGSIEVDFVE